ncbi:type VI secretion protein [Streptomyces fagopyri]|uniref:Type VI secretion protein n=1 Tax=Streptomyces fagopyri TaxID=2662397 RepID=A0A5Q0LFZ2_9ACTN|nr:type IV secretory system conjugative DNA transfer family protein [Streptomyces fagopyri]QFZ75536.1 type VI secretion protein [Streptomyces fagopyri]
MRPDERRQERAGGVPDGLLVGVLAFLLGLTLLVWSATGIAGWLARGAWPAAVTVARTPLALRHLIGQPQDVAGAWPDTPAGQLSGYGLFWGLFIGQLMVLIVLTVFVMGTMARWRAVRARRKAGAYAPQGQASARVPEPAREPVQAYAETPKSAEEPTPHEVPVPRPAPEPAEPPAQAPQPTPAPLAAAGRRTGGWEGTPAAGTVVLGPAEARRPTATQAVRDAEGPVLVITSDPTTWAETKDARAKLGPVLLYDPTHRCDTPARLHWSPAAGCEDKATAAARATALLAPVRPTAKVDRAMADVAETLLRSYLHAAAVEGKAFRHVHRWAQGSQVQDAVRALRTNPKAASGAAGELEAALTSHPERRDIAQELTARALSSLFTVNIREACTANRSDALALDSFVDEGGTLYVVGEPIEDPRANPGAMPLLTALASSVVERGRRMAERSSSGRLDPPLTLVLDDVAAVAPLPQLPDLLTAGAGQGLPTLALLRSQEQGRARWPHAELPI